jgi:hypothetical protein
MPALGRFTAKNRLFGLLDLPKPPNTCPCCPTLARACAVNVRTRPSESVDFPWQQAKSVEIGEFRGWHETCIW